MKTLINKISFHIPGFKYIEGKMLNIYLDDFKAVLNKELEKVGIEAFGTVNSFAQIFSCSIDMAAQVPLPASARHLNSNHSARTTFAY